MSKLQADRPAGRPGHATTQSANRNAQETTARQRELKKARDHRYEMTDKGRARKQRYEETRIRVRMAGGAVDASYRVRPEKRDELLGRLSDHREQQRRAYAAFSSALETDVTKNFVTEDRNNFVGLDEDFNLTTGMKLTPIL